MLLGPRPAAIRKGLSLKLLFTVALELLFVVAGYQAYSTVRVLVAGQQAVAVQHGYAILHGEQALHLSFERGAQRATLHALWLVRDLNYVYVFLYLPLIWFTGVVLFVRDRSRYTRARRTFLISGAIGLIVFAWFPVAPPRLLPGAGFVDTIDRFYHEAGYASNPLANQFAAVPSFHFGWSVLASYSLWRVLPNGALRWVLLLIPALMLTAIVVTANHLWFDALVGVLVVLVAAWLAEQVNRIPRLDIAGHTRAPLPLNAVEMGGSPAVTAPRRTMRGR